MFTGKSTCQLFFLTLVVVAELPAASYASNTIRVDSIDYINEQGESVEQKIKSVFRANDAEVLLLKALSGSAYVIVPEFILGDEVKNGELIPLLTDLNLSDYNALYAIYPHRDLPIRTRLFFDAVRDFIGKWVPRWERNIPDFDKMYHG